MAVRKCRTHFDKEESVAGFDLQVFPIAHGRVAEEPVADEVIKDDGNFNLSVPAGRYEVAIARDMHAGAYSIYPKRKIRVQTGRITRLRMHIRSEYFN